MIFSDILTKGLSAGMLPAKTIAAREWYRDAASQSLDGRTSVSASSLVRQFEPKRKVSKLEPGFMYMFKYDPKGKKTLPYYDTFPVIFPIQLFPDGFMGLNFHYLSLMPRARLLNALYSTSTDKRFDEKTKVIINYKLLLNATKYKEYKPTMKRYLNEHVRTPFLEITAKEWDIAVFLPTEGFKKATKETVWAESRKIISNV